MYIDKIRVNSKVSLKTNKVLNTTYTSQATARF